MIDIHKLTKLSPTLQESIREQKQRFFGNVVLLEGTDLYSRAIRHFTKNQYIHSAMQTHRNSARTVTRKGKEYINLLEPCEDIVSYLILEHKGMEEYHRKELRKIERYLETDYDFRSIFILALKHQFNLDMDDKDISSKFKINCSNRIAKGIELVDLKWSPTEKHWSQAEPHDFLNENYRLIKEWQKKD